jgi:hypothetical protein
MPGNPTSCWGTMVEHLGSEYLDHDVLFGVSVSQGMVPSHCCFSFFGQITEGMLGSNTRCETPNQGCQG